MLEEAGRGGHPCYYAVPYENDVDQGRALQSCGAMDFFEDVDPGQAIYFVLCRDEKTPEMSFAGMPHD